MKRTKEKTLFFSSDDGIDYGLQMNEKLEMSHSKQRCSLWWRMRHRPVSLSNSKIVAARSAAKLRQIYYIHIHQTLHFVFAINKSGIICHARFYFSHKTLSSFATTQTHCAGRWMCARARECSFSVRCVHIAYQNYRSFPSSSSSLS